MSKIIKKNLLFIVMIIGICIIYMSRYNYLPTYIVSNPDSQIAFHTQDKVLEQTWQPVVKMISGVEIPYYAEDTFDCDVEMKIFTDDYSEVIANVMQENYSFAEGTSGAIDFTFERTDVIPGERYHIQISLINSSKDGTLQIASGSNYGGCTIAGEDVDQAVALTMTFAKFSKLFWLVSVLFPLIAFSMLIMTITGKKWEEVVAISLFFEGIFLFFCGMFEQLVLGINLVYILAIISLLLAIYLFNKKDICIKDLLSPGLFIYFTLFLVIIVTSNGDWLGKRDDLSHWGATVRDMFFYDSYAKHYNTTILNIRYLPFAALIEYVFVYMNGLFGENLLLIAYQTMILSVLIIVSKPLQKKCKLQQLIPTLAIMICIPVIFFFELTGSIMVDPLQAAVMAYALICYYSEEMNGFNRVRILLSLVVLTLIKDLGLAYAGMVALIMFGDTVYMQIQRRKLAIKEILYPIICLCTILAMYVSWQIYVTSPLPSANEINPIPSENEINSDETVEDDTKGTKVATSAFSDSGISIDGLIKVLKGEGEEYQYILSQKYWIEVFDGETFSIAMLKFSFVKILMFIGFITISLAFLGIWNNEKARMYAFAALILIAGACLAVFMQVTLWFTFSKWQALDLLSLERYLGVYPCALFIMVIYLMYQKLMSLDAVKVKEEYLMYAVAFSLIISMPWEGILVESNDMEVNATEDMIYGHDEIAEILRSVSKRGDRAKFICSESDGYSEFIFRNAVCPLISTHANWRIVASEEILDEQYDLYKEKYDEEYKADVVSVEEFQNQLEEYQYLVLFHIDEGFLKSYSGLFGEVPIKDGSVYKVANTGNEVSLELIGTAGIKKWR